MCCRSLLFTGYRTQFVPTSFTAHSMSMLVTMPHWLSCNTRNKRWILSSSSSSLQHHIVLLINIWMSTKREGLFSPLCKCRPIKTFWSCRMQWMEQSIEQWHDWQRAASTERNDEITRQWERWGEMEIEKPTDWGLDLHLNCSVARCLWWQLIDLQVSAVKKRAKEV